MRNGLISVLIAVSLCGCAAAQQDWHAKNITGIVPDLAIAMTDDNGRAIDAHDYRGSIDLLFFGYSYCTDECPATLARLAQAISRMKTGRALVRVLFVSVDPGRDTVARLHTYVDGFGPEFVGLRGTPDQLAALAKRYRVTYALDPPDAHGDYDVRHSDGVFVFDGAGKARLLIRPQDTIAAITADLDHLAAEAP